MRILKVNFAAYGHFINRPLDLSEGNEGFHIVYGPNEAGKSIALRGIKALLYGIPERTTDNFLHEGGKLRIEAVIQASDGRTLPFVRRKGRAKTLLAPDGTTIADETLAAFLGGVGLEQFVRMFALSHEDLLSGGRDIAMGKGGMGESLFAAGIGGVSLHRILEELDEEAESLFKPRATTKFINTKISDYVEARRESEKATLPGREWEAHTSELRRLETRRDANNEELLRLRPRIRRLERLLEAIPIIVERKQRMKTRADMGEVLMLPADFADSRKSIAGELRRAEDAKARGRERVSAIQANLDDLVVPDALLVQEDVVTDLHRQLGSHLKAMRDLPGLEGEAVQLREDVETILRDLRPGLSMEDVESLRLGTTEREMIRGLVTSHSGLVEKRQAAKKAISTIDSKISDVEDELNGLAAVRDVRSLRDLIRRVQKEGDITKSLAQAWNNLKAAEDRAGIDMRKLNLWSGTLEALEALAIPVEETIARFGAELGDVQVELDGVSSRIDELEERSGEVKTELNALLGAGTVPSEEELVETRKHRERGWNIVREVWLEGKDAAEEATNYDSEHPLDEAYERSVHRADDVSDRLRREAERVVQNAKLEAEIAGLRDRLNSLRDERNSLEGRRQRLQTEWDQLWKQIGVEALSPAEMRSWLGRQQKLVEQAEKVRGYREAVSGIQEQIESFRAELATKLASVGDALDESATFEELLSRAEVVVERNDQVESLRTGLKKSLAGLSEDRSQAKISEAEASESLLEWNRQWSEALARLAMEGTVTPAAANVILERIQDLFEKIRELGTLRKRINGIERDRVDFASRTSDLVGRFAPDLAIMSSAEAAAELNARLAEGHEKAVTREQLRRQLEGEKEELKETEDVVEKKTIELLDMCRQAKAKTPEQLEGVEKRSQEAAALDEEIKQLERQLVAHSGSGGVDDLVREAEGVDADVLPSEIEELARRIREIESEQANVGEMIGNEKNELRRMNGQSQAADSSDKAHGILAQIREAAERYVHLRLSSAILKAEIERYRVRNQGPILKRASEIFSRLTLESFSGLTTNYTDEDTPILVGVRLTGQEVGVEGMSDGTCDQLYLSLRLASLEKYLQENQPLPFIIDDLLINFDDQRAEAALNVLSELASKTQVIFFTHHRHLVDLAAKSGTLNQLFMHDI
jgi:uncharacterized protein YhaN